MKKKSAVEWLVQQLVNDGKLIYDDYKAIEQAKEIEKKQIIDSYNEGRKAGVGDYVDIEWGRNVTELTAEEYYNETFKSE